LFPGGGETATRRGNWGGVIPVTFYREEGKRKTFPWVWGRDSEEDVRKVICASYWSRTTASTSGTHGSRTHGRLRGE